MNLTELTEQYKLFHTNNPNSHIGEWTLGHVDSISELINKFNVQSMLDYGSGKGLQYSVDKIHNKYFNNILPTCYDPGVIGIDKLPNDSYDMVISTDVLEHIPENFLSMILSELFEKANTCVYLGICNTPDVSTLPNGTNMHLTCKNGMWWINKIKPYAKVYTRLYVYGSMGFCTASINNHKLIDFPLFESIDKLKKL